jgi:hypothetical protein
MCVLFSWIVRCVEWSAGLHVLFRRSIPIGYRVDGMRQLPCREIPHHNGCGPVGELLELPGRGIFRQWSTGLQQLRSGELSIGYRVDGMRQLPRRQVPADNRCLIVG